MSPWVVYLWLQADKWGSMASMVALFATPIYVVWLGFSLSDDDDFPRPPLVLGAVAALALLATALLPSSRTIAAMYVLPRIAESRVIQTDLPELYDMAIGAGLAANPEVTGRMTARQLAHEALIIVLACHDETDSELDKEGEA